MLISPYTDVPWLKDGVASRSTRTECEWHLRYIQCTLAKGQRSSAVPCVVEFQVLSHLIADWLEAGAPACCPSSSQVVSHILLAKAPRKIRKWKCKFCLVCTSFTLLWRWGCSLSNPHHCGHCLYLTVLPLSTPSVSIYLPSWVPEVMGQSLLCSCFSWFTG